MHLEIAVLLVLLVLGALLVPVVSPRLRVPEAVGQIAYGVLLGLLGVGMHGEAHEVLHLLAELGFILLMFGAGLEIDVDAIERGGRNGLLTGLGVAAGFFVVGGAITWFLGLPPIYVLVLGATSIGLGVAVLRETGLTTERVGQLVLLVGSLGELLTLIGMTIFDVSMRTGVSWSMATELGKLVALFAAGGLVLRWLRAFAWWHPSMFRRVFERHDASEVGVRAALVACLAFVLLAVWLHIEPILGAFIAGAVARIVFRDVRVLEHKMSALSSGFFVPIFFISVGIGFDLALLSAEGMKTAMLLGAGVVVARVLPSLALISADVSPREVLGAAVLLGAPLTLLVAIEELGRGVGALSDSEGSAIVLLAILLSLVLPVVFRGILGERGGSH